jgi:hypothetical protein
VWYASFGSRQLYKKLDGVAFAAPHTPEILLEVVYGRDWKLPRDYWAVWGKPAGGEHTSQWNSLWTHDCAPNTL